MAFQINSSVGNRLGKRAGSSSGKRAPLMNEINVTPFVDVMLVLLIIFMVTAPLMTTGVKVDLPDSSTPPIKKQEEPLTITINKKGEVFLQETKIESKNLGEKLKAILKAKKDSRIYIRADKKLNYGRVMETIDIINKSGYRKIALITDPNTPNKK